MLCPDTDPTSGFSDEDVRRRTYPFFFYMLAHAMPRNETTARNITTANGSGHVLKLQNGGSKLQNGEELACALSAIPKTTSTLNLSGPLAQLSLNDLLKQKGSLTQIETLYLSYADVCLMDQDKRQALKSWFPNLSNTIFKRGYNTLGASDMEPPIVTSNPYQISILARRFGFPTLVCYTLEYQNRQLQKLYDSNNEKDEVTTFELS